MKAMNIALLGNPNVGKSSIFNALTGLNQHTGNWTGVTVESKSGICEYKGNKLNIIDLPGTYTLFPNSIDEKIARDYIAFNKPDITVVVCDGTAMHKGISLVLQAKEITKNVICCINMFDEVKKKKICIDTKQLKYALNVPIVFSSARSKNGLELLKKEIIDYKPIEDKILLKYPFENIITDLTKKIDNQLNEDYKNRWLAIKLLEKDKDIIEKYNLDLNLVDNTFSNIEDIIRQTIHKKSNEIFTNSISCNSLNNYNKKLDEFFTNKITGIPIMIIMFLILFWVTISGANYISEFLANIFNSFEMILSKLLIHIKISTYFHDLLIFGLYRILSWVVSVMLPPMAIFFPLFTILEDFGYLPRVAFNLDKVFAKCNACGKQSLTMCMGIGCNAVGICSARIINSSKERLIAIITNNFMPCNGRFPAIIATISMFLVYGVKYKSFVASLILTGVLCFSVLATFIVSKLLSITILKGKPSTFALELPPYRKPQLKKVLVRSFLDRTVKILMRAVSISLPAGVIIWLLANTHINDISILSQINSFFDPFARIIGLDGVILVAFILGIPANEIVLPIMLMSYMSSGILTQVTSLTAIKDILVLNGWNIRTAICVIIFFVFHWPCATTLLTIKKETGGLKWTFVSALVPTIIGCVLCILVSIIFRFFGI